VSRRRDAHAPAGKEKNQPAAGGARARQSEGTEVQKEPRGTTRRSLVSSPKGGSATGKLGNELCATKRQTAHESSWSLGWPQPSFVSASRGVSGRPCLCPARSTRSAMAQSTATAGWSCSTRTARCVCQRSENVHANAYATSASKAIRWRRRTSMGRLGETSPALQLNCKYRARPEVRQYPDTRRSAGGRRRAGTWLLQVREEFPGLWQVGLKSDCLLE